MQLITSHARELEKLENNLERQRQQLAVCERLAERKKRLLADQKQKQTVEFATELLEQKELDEVRSNVVKQTERKEMIDGIREQKAASAEKIITSVSYKVTNQYGTMTLKITNISFVFVVVLVVVVVVVFFFFLTTEILL